MHTKGMLIEQALRRIVGGRPSNRDRVSKVEIGLSLNSILNALLKAQVYEGYNEDGSSLIGGAILATYENIPVTRRDNGRTQVKLPAVPMRVPEDKGVFSVYPAGYPEHEYIPIPTGMFNILMGEKMVNVLGPRFYTWDGGTATIYDDLIAAGITSVDMKLCVMDINALGDNEVLPISPDMAEVAIDTVAKLYKGEPATERIETITPNNVKGEQPN